MDAKPQKPWRSLRVHNENISLPKISDAAAGVVSVAVNSNLSTASSIKENHSLLNINLKNHTAGSGLSNISAMHHSWAKSTPPLSALINLRCGLKNPVQVAAKQRTAFADVSNTARGLPQALRGQASQSSNLVQGKPSTQILKESSLPKKTSISNKLTAASISLIKPSSKRHTVITSENIPPSNTSVPPSKLPVQLSRKPTSHQHTDSLISRNLSSRSKSSSASTTSIATATSNTTTNTTISSTLATSATSNSSILTLDPSLQTREFLNSISIDSENSSSTVDTSNLPAPTTASATSVTLIDHISIDQVSSKTVPILFDAQSDTSNLTSDADADADSDVETSLDRNDYYQDTHLPAASQRYSISNVEHPTSQLLDSQCDEPPTLDCTDLIEVASTNTLTSKCPPSISATSNIQGNTSLHDLEESWIDNECDYCEVDYTLRSRTENTTSALTIDLTPKVTARVRRELAAAREWVIANRTVEEVEEDIWDTTMVAEYSDNIFEYMRQLEEKMRPNPFYMDKQTEICWEMRSAMIGWLVQVHQRFGLLPETLFLAVNIIDRFLTLKIVSYNKLQLVGATAILVAAKYEEIRCPSIKEIIYMVDRAYTAEEILKAERYMLSLLQFELGWPGPMSFLRRVSKADQYDVETRTLAKYFLEVTITDERFVACTPSFLAAGAHCLSRLMLCKGDWSLAHVHYSQYTYSQMRPLVSTILECCEDAREHHSTVYEKYAEERLHKASLFVRDQLVRGFRLPSASGVSLSFALSSSSTALSSQNSTSSCDSMSAGNPSTDYTAACRSKENDNLHVIHPVVLPTVLCGGGDTADACC